MLLWKCPLLNQTDFDKIRYVDPPQVPSQQAFQAIFNEPRVVILIKSIRHSSGHFIGLFMDQKDQAIKVLQLIDDQYGNKQQANL